MSRQRRPRQQQEVIVTYWCARYGALNMYRRALGQWRPNWVWIKRTTVNGQVTSEIYVTASGRPARRPDQFQVAPSTLTDLYEVPRPGLRPSDAKLPRELWMEAGL